MSLPVDVARVGSAAADSESAACQQWNNEELQRFVCALSASQAHSMLLTLAGALPGSRAGGAGSDLKARSKSMSCASPLESEQTDWGVEVSGHVQRSVRDLLHSMLRTALRRELDAERKQSELDAQVLHLHVETAGVTVSLSPRRSSSPNATSASDVVASAVSELNPAPLSSAVDLGPLSPRRGDLPSPRRRSELSPHFNLASPERFPKVVQICAKITSLLEHFHVNRWHQEVRFC